MKSGTKPEKAQEAATLNNSSEKLLQQSMNLLYNTFKRVNEIIISEIKTEAQIKQEESFNTYYTLSLKLPSTEKIYQIGHYHTEELARMIYPIVYEALKNDPNIKQAGWFDLRINGYKGTIVKCPAGLMLQEPGCGITMIQTQLTFEELKKIAEWVPAIIEHAALSQKVQHDEEEPAKEYEIVISK